MKLTFHTPNIFDLQVTCFKISFATCGPFFLCASIAHDMVVFLTRTRLTSMFGIKVMRHSQVMTNFMSHKLQNENKFHFSTLILEIIKDITPPNAAEVGRHSLMEVFQGFDPELEQITGFQAMPTTP